VVEGKLAQNSKIYGWRRGFWFFMASIAPIVALFIYTGPPIYAKLWHIAHGNVAQCGEFTVPVPNGWWARNSGCSLVTPSPAYTVRNRNPVQIFFNLSHPPAVSDSQWKQNMLNQTQVEGDTLLHTTELTVAGSKAVCFEYGATSTSAKSIIACNVDRRMVVTFFFDHQDWKIDFYRILSGIR
jgi:hypothetical protein